MKSTHTTRLGFVMAAALVVAPTGLVAQENDERDPGRKVGYSDDTAGFGSPNTPGQLLLEEDIRTEPLLRFPEIDDTMESWYDTKARIKDQYGLKFGFDYTYWYQRLSDSIGEEDYASSAVFRAYGEWTPFNRGEKNAGRLVYTLDHRHKIGSDIPAASLAGEAGYIGQTVTLFGDGGWDIVNLNWQQSLGEGGGIIAGRYDPNDYITALGYANPWTAFSNLSTLLNSSIVYPDSSYGIGGGAWLNDQWYVKGSINDANGTLQNYQFFRDGAEFFKWGELGWSPSKSDRYTTNIHVSAWHVDEREEVGIDSAQGVMLGANWTNSDQRWMWFARAGWSDGDAAIYEESYTLGFMRKYRRNSDLLGLAINWGQPPQHGLDAQTTGELFYRVQLAQNLAITPNLQLLKDPALNDQDDAVWAYGLRIRLTL